MFKFYKLFFGLLTRSSAPVIITNKVSELHFLRSPEWFPRFVNPAFSSPASAPFPGERFAGSGMFAKRVAPMMQCRFQKLAISGEFPPVTHLRQHRAIRQGGTAEDFVPDQSFQTGGILDVFPGLETAELAQKIRCDPQTQLRGAALRPNFSVPVLTTGAVFCIISRCEKYEKCDWRRFYARRQACPR